MTGTFYIEKSAIHGFLYLYLCLFFAFLRIISAQECDPRNCNGPIMFYKDLNCKPIYNELDTCCAIGYDCSHLNERSPFKCYANNNEYRIGEKLEAYDRSSPCDQDCICEFSDNNIAKFMCTNTDCLIANVRNGCYFKPKPNTCCDGEIICVERNDDIVTCEVDGQVYTDGQEFYPSDNPYLVCTCMEGYLRKSVHEYCRNIKCGTELRYSAEIRKNCAPIYSDYQWVQTSCPINYRCQNENDRVLRYSLLQDISDLILGEFVCVFGDILMQIGDELNQATDYSSICVRCVCEVPPAPTCQRLSKNECNTKF
ncbi:PREDICTED: uncharacterized protein LOC105367709 [Ceratosolen solmsi marchali]|uniref:Uncharacterized protein LOC105367709 n=1 Tax=Ceratosolen solmsi marchali TaxID=326594 RepID=A0AAJ6YUP6_9HYME|nr:PREDICTED: uncharacterized protein LOC105367709 [Ceratosolen solmsi marchali]